MQNVAIVKRILVHRILVQNFFESAINRVCNRETVNQLRSNHWRIERCEALWAIPSLG
jgi:hypothetical protein